MKLFRRSLISFIFFMLTGVTTVVFAQTTWQLVTGYPAKNFQNVNIQQFAANVEKASSGKLKMIMHNDGSLFKLPEIKRAVQGGQQAQVGAMILLIHSNEWPLFGLDNLPFLTEGLEKVWKLHLALKPALEKKLAEQGMSLLYTIPWPGQGLFVKKPTNSTAGLKGLKWRAYSPTMARVAELVGAQPVTVQSAELSQAMATGVVESYMSSAQTGLDTKTYEHIKYFYDLQGWNPITSIVVNTAALNALDAPTKQAVLKAAADGEKRGWAEVTSVHTKVVAELKAHGMSVLPPSPQLVADFRKVGDILLKEWLAKAGPEGIAVLNAYNKP